LIIIDPEAQNVTTLEVYFDDKGVQMSCRRQRIQNRGIFTQQHRRPKSTFKWHSYQLLSGAEKRKEHRGEIVGFESFQDRATQTHATGDR
jgi:hypothetical protein